MQVSVTTTTNIVLRDVVGHTEILVTLEDTGPGVGRVTLQEGSTSKTAYWNGMGDCTVAEFIGKRATPEFLLSCFDNFGSMFRKIDSKALIEQVVADIQRIQEEGRITEEQAVALTTRTAYLSPVSDVNGLQVLGGELMADVYGPMWTNTVNENFLGKSEGYLQLKSRIAVVRSVLADQLPA